MIPIIVFSLLLILLIVFCVLSAKNWHWSNIVFLILCYLAGVAACVGLADVLDKRTKALALVEKTEMEAFGLRIDSDNDGIDDAIDAEIGDDRSNGPDNDNDGISDSKANLALVNQAEYVVYGAPNSLSYSPNSLRGLSERYDLEIYGRGRVWQKCVPGAEGNFRVVQLAVPRAENALTLIGSELYVFRDSAIEFDGQEVKVPTQFIGSMLVIAETPENLTLEPSFILSQSAFEIKEGVTWTLYQKMPSDRHDVFKSLVDSFDPTSDELQNSQITEYREELEKLLPAIQLGFEIESADNEIASNAEKAYERYIDHICFDGMSIARIDKWIDPKDGTPPQRKSGDFVCDDENIFTKYQFTADCDEAFVVDADKTKTIYDADAYQGAYQPDGRVVDRSLQNEGQEDVRFKEGDVVLIAEGYTLEGQEPVKSFIERGLPVKPLGTVFVRGLHDFPQLLIDYSQETDDLVVATAKAQARLAIAEKNLGSITEQTNVRDDIIAKLKDDKQNLQRDLATVTEGVARRQQQVIELQEKIAKLETAIRNKRAVSR